MDPRAACGSPRTAAQQAGDAAERAVGIALEARGWRVLGRGVRAGRAELDLVAVDPGPPAMLVVVEVRWRRSRSFGLPEETVDGRKLGQLRAGAGRLVEMGTLPGGRRVPALPVRIDLVVMEPGLGTGPPRLRHHRAIA